MIRKNIYRFKKKLQITKIFAREHFQVFLMVHIYCITENYRSCPMLENSARKILLVVSEI
jgi:hypothetical protein